MRLLPARLNDKPHYVWHPGRVLRRVLGGTGGHGSGAVRTAQLAWDLDLGVYAEEAIGRSILTSGVFDPGVSETLFRLLDPGEVAVDAGANVGYMTSIMAARSGPGGMVHACEPHPEVGELLGANVARWANRHAAEVRVHHVALSDRRGTGQLAAGPGFAANRGLASLRVATDEAGAAATEVHEVRLWPMDDLLGDAQVGVLKIDVEGHEPEVLRGARSLLAGRRVRDIVFEAHGPYPDDATALVESAGYELFSLGNDLFGLELAAPDRRSSTAAWPGPSYLATLDPERARARLRPRGWHLPGIGLRTRRRRLS